MKKNGIARRNASESNELKFRKQPLSFFLKENLALDEERLKIAGLMLYWSEGAKGKHTIDLANSDPELVGVFLIMLRKIYGIDEKKLRGYLYYYANQNAEALINKILGWVNQYT